MLTTFKEEVMKKTPTISQPNKKPKSLTQISNEIGPLRLGAIPFHKIVNR